MRIEYEPHGTAGYSCQLTGDAGLVVTVSWSDGEIRVEAAPEDLPTQAVVGAMERYAGHEFDRRRTRDTQKKQHHAKDGRVA